MDGWIDNFKKVNDTGERKKNELLIKALRWIDTIHDFYPVNASARGENIREILSRQYDSKFKGTFIEKSNNGIKKFLDSLETKNVTITPTTVEVGTEDYYHTNFKTITVGKQAIDVQEIIKSYGQKSAAKVLEQFGVPAYAKPADLKLSLTNRDFFKEKTDQTNFLADVILTFFLGEDKNRDVYFLIDAAHGRLDCMFQNIDQASTLINVLTIGDSAVTSVEDKTSKGESKWCGVKDYQNKFKRKVYLQDPDTIPYKNDDKRYEITSNEFTQGKFEMWYQDAALPFSKQNNASARLYVKKKGTEKKWFSEFSILASGSPNSGTSVGTLKKLIIAIDENDDRTKAKKAIENKYKYETQFNLTPILCGMLDDDTITKNEIISFLYDYKRAGDHEQADSANYLYKKGLNVILLTGDRLCSLYARLINQPCIYIHDGNYDMYRYLPNVSQEQKNEQAKKLLETRREFILSEIGKVKPDLIARLTGLEEHIKSLITPLTDTFEDQLYKFIFESLLEKINKQKIKRQTFASEQTKIQKTITAIKPDEEEANVEVTIKKLNEEYDIFYKNNKELFDFALHPDDALEKKKEKFNSPALDYDNKIVKNILNYFNQFTKKNIVSGVSRDGPLAVKKNLIRRIGGAEYKIVLDDLIHYLKKCNAYKGEDEIDAENVLSDAPQLKERIEDLVGEKDFGDHTYDIYEPIFDQIKEFISKKIEKEYKAEPETDAIDDVTLPEELAELEKQILENEKERLNLMKISLYDWAKQKNPKAELAVIKEIYKQRDPRQNKIPWTEEIAEERKDQQTEEDAELKDKITELDATIDKNQFQEILNSKLKEEYHIFYDAVETSDVVPMDIDSPIKGGARPVEPDYIENLLANYYASIQTAHYQELVDVYLSVTEDSEDEKKEKIGRIYNYITNTTLYPENVYDYLYKGFVENPVKINNKRKFSESPVKVGPSKMKKSSKRRSAATTSTARSESIELAVPDVLMESISEEPLRYEMIHHEPSNKRKGHTSSGLPYKKARILSSSDHKVPSFGGKRTRKYKNRHNKKTRQHRKKTRKNRTLKKKRGKGKRTRRISI